MRRCNAVVILVALIAALVGETSTAQTKSAPRPDQQHAVWTPELETSYGISESVFSDYGLSRLGADNLKGALARAWIAGYAQGLKSPPAINCGPETPQPDLTKVKVVLGIPDDVPSEIASRLRQGIRQIRDVQVVFKLEDADVSLSVLGLAQQNMAHDRIGYIVSVAENRPCTMASGQTVVTMFIPMNHYIRTGNSAETVVDGIVADMDADLFEQVRKWNANRKSLGEKPNE